MDAYYVFATIPTALSSPLPPPADQPGSQCKSRIEREFASAPARLARHEEGLSAVASAKVRHVGKNLTTIHASERPFPGF